jgi:hypothetical protein
VAGILNLWRYVKLCVHPKVDSIESWLEKWNEEVFENVGLQKKEMEKGLSELDMISGERPLSVDEIIKRE